MIRWLFHSDKVDFEWVTMFDIGIGDLQMSLLLHRLHGQMRICGDGLESANE